MEMKTNNNNQKSFFLWIIFSSIFFIISLVMMIVSCEKEEILGTDTEPFAFVSINKNCIVETNIMPVFITNGVIDSISTYMITNIITNCTTATNGDDGTASQSSSIGIVHCETVQKSTNHYPTVFCTLEDKLPNKDIKGNIIISNLSESDYHIKHFYHDSRQRWKHTVDIHDDIILLESGDKTNFYFKSTLCSEGWVHYIDGEVNLDEVFHYLYFYDSETNFIFKITNTISNIARGISEDHCVYDGYSSINFGYHDYLNIGMSIDDTTFTNSYWGTTNEQ